ncbi:MAG: hypothetical protein MUF87_10430 [Anaerolineae bacterium]|jgi:hypothetical protein|nr:hypothetical protein [Anaerolineae bacterium]
MSALVAQSHPTLLNLYTLTLKRDGYTIHTATTRAALKTALAHTHFSIIILDITLDPDLTLFESYDLGATTLVIVSVDARHRARCEQLGLRYLTLQPGSVTPIEHLLQTTRSGS